MSDIKMGWILNLSNTYDDHKKTCAHNCNVSLAQLREVAMFLRNKMVDEGPNRADLERADEWINSMKEHS